jgi:hypothetical protein
VSDWLEAARRIVERKSAEVRQSDGTWTTDIDLTCPECGLTDECSCVIGEVSKSGSKILPGPILLDLFTASMLVQVYDALTVPENKSKFAAMPLERAVSIGWQLVDKAKAS